MLKWPINADIGKVAKSHKVTTKCFFFFCETLKCSIIASISNPPEVEVIDNNIEAMLQEILDDDDDDYPASSSHVSILRFLVHAG